ncbi:hypothetical protein [Paenirhodobacter populi]|uniref:hypothetical protein n=1 Tax=Paenirhodobacter populi TaxID=2306993 RepID=UPI000FE31C4D|nr:hypothetical protein [Sinirhodobacter populi]RWR09734.1 hypothetical protein D2T32_05155 [Sinirhodobacter populi]
MPDVHKIRAAYEIAARLVSDYGEEFLPVFLRLEVEMQKLDGMAAAMERARAVTGRAQMTGEVVQIRATVTKLRAVDWQWGGVATEPPIPIRTT